MLIIILRRKENIVTLMMTALNPCTVLTINAVQVKEEKDKGATQILTAHGAWIVIGINAVLEQKDPPATLILTAIQEYVLAINAGQEQKDPRAALILTAIQTIVLTGNAGLE